MIDQQKLIEWLDDEMESEIRQMERAKDQKSPGYAMAIGYHDAYMRLKELLQDGEFNHD